MKNTSHFNEDDSPDFGNSWLITYSDMITIILCFFIVFFTFTAEEASFLQEIKESLTSEIEDLNVENEKLKEEQESLKSLIVDSKGKTNENFMDYLENNDLMDSVYIIDDKKGLILRFRDGVLFDSGSSEVSESGYEVLNDIGTKIKSLENQIIIEGFTDNVPIKNSIYPSNWELSAARAIGVAKYFIDDVGVKQDRISVSGYGEQRPIDTNETEEGRRNNRRIEITILN